MKKHVFIFLILLMSIALVGAALAQTAPQTFVQIQQIGKLRPTGIRYEPSSDRFIWVDTQGQLVLVNATTYQTETVLYEAGAYNEYRFSQDARWLAVALDKRADLWDMTTNAIVATISPESTLGVEGPLWFADDGSFLVFNSRVPTPQSLRRSENDTSLVPWIWDLRDARDEATSSLPNQVRALPLFDYRNKDFILGPGNIVITSQPARLQTLIVTPDGIEILSEIPDDRLEFTPVDAWRSARNDWLYVRPDNRNSLVQVNPQTGAPVEIPIGRDIGTGIETAIEGFLFAEEAQIIGQPVSRETNSLLQTLLGQNYRADYNHHPLTVMLLDVLNPLTPTVDSIGLLVYIRDEATGTGVIDFLQPQDASQLMIHPDGQRLMLRRLNFPGQIEVYNIASGLLEQNYYPEFSDEGRGILAYNGAGDAIISGFQRFDAATGATTYLDWHIYSTFDNFYFTQDSRSLMTLAGSRWQQWDIETGQVVRQEFLNLRGSVIAASPDAHRFLTRIDTPSGTGMEIVDVGQDEQPFVLFEALPNREIVDIVSSPDWQNYIVVYSANEYGQHYPGNEIALYNLYEGKKWFLAGDDLPHSVDGRYYGWLDADTAYVYAEDFGNGGVQERIYGIEYNAAGVPTCLEAAFPNDWQKWQPLWWRLSRFVLRGDDLNRVSQQICAIVSKTPEVQAVDAYFTPAPTPTRIFPTPRPVVIPGVPECLTQRFSSEALKYAQDWRIITATLNDEQIEEMTKLLCEGLSGESSPERIYSYTSNIEVIAIDMATGLRQRSTFVPATDAGEGENAVDMGLIYEAFEEQFRFYPDYSLLSPDKTLFAVGDYPLIKIYRLAQSYESMAQTATATQGAPEATARILQVRPTATQPADTLGVPRPTFTPTVTPTSPPTPAGGEVQFAAPDTEELCPITMYTPANPAPEYAPSGTLLVTKEQPRTSHLWRLNPLTGEMRPDETIPQCGTNLNCNYSFDENWILLQGSSIQVMRPDGTDERLLYRPFEQSEFPISIFWQSPGILEYTVEDYVPDESMLPLKITRRLNVETGEIFAPPYEGDESVFINEVQAEIVSLQPIADRFVVVRLPFNTGLSTGYEYYLADRETGTWQYLARFADESAGMTFQWHPLGRYLYYRYPESSEWFVFNPATQEHRYLGGELPGGEWSRDGRYVVYPYGLTADETEDRIEAGQPLPRFAIWDSDTGNTRLYCIADLQRSPSLSAFKWSPDSRYLALEANLYNNPDAEVAFADMLIVDTATGSVTNLGFEAGFVTTWMEDR